MGSDSHMYTLLMRRNYYIKRSYDWYHRRVWCQHLLCTEKKMSMFRDRVRDTLVD